MRGHVYRRPTPNGWSRWYAVIDLPAGRDGRRRQRTTTHDTKRDAQAWLAQRVQELRAGEVYDTKVTVAEYLVQWLDGKASLRPSTHFAYTTHVQLYLSPHLGHLRLGDLRAHHVEAMFREILAGNHRRERPVGPTTLRRINATLLSALGTAVRRGLIRRNPAATVELARAARPRATAWTPEQLSDFFAAVSKDRLHPLYLLLGLRGLRRGEAVGLRWSDVDLDAGQLRVEQQVVKVGSQLVIGPPKSHAGNRTVALDRTTAELLRWHRRRQRLDRWKAETLWVDTGLVFTREDGTGLDPAYVSRHFDRLVARHGMPRIRLHDLRHTSASVGLASGETLLEVSRRLGHSSIAITADVYSHISPQTAAESAERLAQLVHP